MEKILDLIKEQNEKNLNEEGEKNSSSKYLGEVDSDLDLMEDFENGNVENIPNNEDEENHYKLLQFELAALDQETIKSKMELEKWKQEAKVFENMMRKPTQNYEVLSDINSDITSKKDESVLNRIK